MTHHTEWTWGLVALGLGVILSLAVVLWGRKARARTAVSPSDELLDNLELRYQQLIGHLKELAVARHQYSPEQFEIEQTRLETAAAQVLREKDDYLRALRHEKEKKAARAEKMATVRSLPTKTSAPFPKWVLGLAGATVFFSLLGIGLNQDSTVKEDGASSKSSSLSPEDAALENLYSQLQASPFNVGLLLVTTDELIRRNDFQEAKRLVDIASFVDPLNVENRIHRALLTATSGNRTEGLKQLTHLAHHFPHAYEALLFAGALSLEGNDSAQALQLFERFLNEAPQDEHPRGLLQTIEKLRLATRSERP